MTNSTTPLWRAWVSFIDSMLTTGGWVNTTDTGQLTISTSTPAAGTNTKVGYRVYHMGDTLQATAPVFMRVDYGSGSAINTPSFWITLGTGSDGAGNITTVTFGPAQVQASTNGANACDSYGSADTNRLQLLMFVRSGANDLLIFSIERSKDSTGADTADGLMLAYNNVSNGVQTMQYVVRAGGGQPTGESGLSIVLSNISGTTGFGSNVGVALGQWFKGFAQQPGLGIIAVNSADYVAEAPITMSVYGTSHTFQLGNSAANQVCVATGNGGFSARGNTRVGIRYE